MATKSKEPDRIEVDAEAGTVAVYLDTKRYALRRPKIGEQRRFDDALAAIRVAQDEDSMWLVEQSRSNGEALKAADHKEITNRAHDRQDERVRWWWDLVIPTLCDLKLPDLGVEDLPLEFAHGDIITKATTAWIQGPQAPGGE